MSTATLAIRVYQDDDEADVVALWRVAFPDDPPWNEPDSVIRRKVAFQPELFLVGVLDGRVVATVLAGYDGFRGWLYHLAVHPEHRRKGFGGLMMQEAERRLDALGCAKINLQVRATNPEVLQLYQRLGYAIEDRVSLGKRLQ